LQTTVDVSVIKKVRSSFRALVASTRKDVLRDQQSVQLASRRVFVEPKERLSDGAARSASNLAVPTY
jgi:hypothetical protein